MTGLFLTLYNLLWLPFLPLSIEGRRSYPSESKIHHYKMRLKLGREDLTYAKIGGIWIHALSTGEVISALPLARILSDVKTRIHLSLPLYMSSSTASGYKILKSRAPFLDRVFVMPFDAPWLMKDLVRSLRPSIFILVEGDVWPNLLRFLKTIGTRCFLVNARMSPLSYSRYLKLARLGVNLFSLFDAVFVASQEMEKIYGEFVPPSKIFFMGNIKWDAVREKAISVEERKRIMENLGINDDEVPIWIAGSVHRHEEETILKAHQEITKAFPKAVLILAPRRVPEDVGYFVKTFGEGGFTVCRRSLGDKITSPKTVYIVDTVGELMNFYGIAKAAFVGGSLVPMGGHNLLEPAIYRIPVCWGPFVFNFSDIARSLKNLNSGIEVHNHEDIKDFVIHSFTSSSNLGYTLPFENSPTLSVISKILEFSNEAFQNRGPWQ
ncbi:MAG: hypothetical protein N2260_02885 [Syntrophobacterales bacterium]|nr:hypothetical protein [Syntrophobacterales bacterium]